MIVIPCIIITAVVLTILGSAFLDKKSQLFNIGDTVYWRCVEEVGNTNSQWTVTLKKGTVVSSDVRVCIEEDNENKTLVFIEKEKLYTKLSKLKSSIGAKLTANEEFYLEASKVRI